jgi:hypothetical protein
MKKNKAIELIMDTYNKNVYQDYEMYKEEAEDILIALEKSGMLPPLCTVTIKDGKHTPTERRWDHED